MSDESVGSPLSPDEQKTLLAVARTAIEQAYDDTTSDTIHVDSSRLFEKLGAFVTLHNDGVLRGCIGYVFAYKPLVETVKEMAVAAAMRDPRFVPVDQEELPFVDIEISVLSPLRDIRDIQEIEIGIHGLYISRGAYSGLLLPQVALEYNWDREAFLEQTCRKAGLPLNAWQDEETSIKIFSAQVFGEKMHD
ncbi:AmmeMemoRadiSam system protein A [candidate division KSB1 bacterium]|nr:AmmeMemoRadiSam system protein A [candidate division KSB1 bacterium]RQW07135.1 MAG: AmmeMemoRadiSam system protein A [candidate division KSB1 bacterium]